MHQPLRTLTQYCNTDSFRAFVRLHSYSSHYFANDMPVFNFFNYSFMQAYRSLNNIERQLFRLCRVGHYGEEPIIVENMSQFLINLNNRFSFSHIKKWINFSLFLLAGTGKLLD